MNNDTKNSVWKVIETWVVWFGHSLTRLFERYVLSMVYNGKEICCYSQGITGILFWSQPSVFVEIRVWKTYFVKICVCESLNGWNRSNRFMLFPRTNNRFVYVYNVHVWLSVTPNHWLNSPCPGLNRINSSTLIIFWEKKT